MQNNTTIDGQTLPLSLKLVFTQAANGPAADGMFDPSVKSKIDPNDYVVKREKTIFEKQLGKGHGVMLVDSKGEAFTLTMAWHAVANDNKGKKQHRYTEMGTMLTRLGGFHSAHVVTSALALKQWWLHRPKRGIVAEILEENGPSRKMFEQVLRWKTITSAATKKDIDKHCNANIVEDKNPGKPHSWYRATDDTIRALAVSLLAFMDKGELTRKDGQSIKLDLSELDKVGLTRARLEAIAAGTMSKRELRKLAP